LAAAAETIFIIPFLSEAQLGGTGYWVFGISVYRKSA